MQQNPVSIRPFLGAKNFSVSRAFYRDIGFNETELNPSLSLFELGGIGFYLQDAYVKDWVDNTMVFFQVADVQQLYVELASLAVLTDYINVKLLPPRTEHWGREFFLHDPSGILLHFGEFF